MALNISSDLVPQVINDYNAYTEDDLLIGLADEITLPKIKNKTTSVSGMGIAGEVDSPVPGQFESMEATLNWNTMYSYATKMMNPNKNIQITLRAAMQNDNGKIRPSLQGRPLAGCPRHHQGRQLRCAAALLRRGLPRHGHRGGAVPAGL